MSSDAGERRPAPGLLAQLGSSERTFLLALVAFAAVHLAWLVYRLPVPLEIFTNEAWNAWHAEAAMGARPLYPSRDELIINNYTPLSFYLVGYLGRLLGDVILAGRILSLASTLAIGALVYRIVRQFGGGPVGAALGSAWWLASMFRSSEDFVGANDPTLSALAIMLAGLTWFLARLDAGKSVLPAIALMVAAGFFKHNLVVLPLLALLWQARRDRAGALRSAVFGGILAAAGLAACYLAYGPDFLVQLTMPREIRWLRPLQHLNRLQFMIAGLALTLLWIAADPRQPATRFVSLWLALGLVSFLLLKLSPGVANNASFELWVGTAVGFGLAMANLSRLPLADWRGLDAARGLVALLVFARLFADPNLEPYRLASPSYRAEIASRADLVRREVAAVRAGPKPVGCTVMSVCFRAGQPFVYDNFGATMRVGARQLSRARYDELIDKMGLHYRLSDPAVSWERNFPRPAEVGVTVPMPR